MSEFCFCSTTKNKSNFFSLLLSDLFLFCSFILSHPLYFSYFIFFFPYLLKLFSFLSPLFITTSLLLLALLMTVSPELIEKNSFPPDSSESKVGFFFTTYRAIVDSLGSKLSDDEDAEFHLFQDLEVYNLVFETLIFTVGESSVEFMQLKHEGNSLQAHESFSLGVADVEEKSIEAYQRKPGVDKLEGLVHVVGLSDDLTCELQEKKEGMLVVDSQESEENQDDLLVGCGFEADNGGGGYSSKVTDNPEMLSSNYLGNFGSMRKEKEWKRTLACKLYEERQNVDEGEGMDLLWEAYEADSGKAKTKSKEKTAKKNEVEYYESEDEEENMDGKLCCLQALRFSTGKMNLGMGRPNLVKISKALKGIGWLHHVGRNGKKRYN